MKFKKPDIVTIILGIVIILPYLGIGGLYFWNKHKNAEIENACFVVVSKQDMSLSVFDYQGDPKCKFPIACGKNPGNKGEEGDLKTPEGVFRISEIQNAENWSHDFGDGKGIIEGAYGPYFIRLFTPNHSGIGIHGTHDNNLLGTRSTEGCIRLQNENVIELVKHIHTGTVVIITPSTDDTSVNEEITKYNN
jgi:lipoprotein-anchoring transpeptidase ErfK/SrfK